MKKFIVAILALVMLLAIATTAGAESTGFVIYNVPCSEFITADQLYKYHGDKYVLKRDTDGIVQISHRVTQTSAIQNNLIAAYCLETKKSMGASWKPANNAPYRITSGAIKSGNSYTGAGRGNSNYANFYGIEKVTISGVIDSYDD